MSDRQVNEPSDGQSKETRPVVRTRGVTGTLDFIGDYQVLRELGRGGQGIVFLAEDRRLSRRVAIKILTSLGAQSDEVLQRFEREARLAARLDHPNICTVHEVGEHDHMPFIVMGFVEGTTLASRISEARSANMSLVSFLDFDEDDGPETPFEPTSDAPSSSPSRADNDVTLLVIERVARAIHHAHENGVIHRDLKPGNIMLSERGEPIILDFGLAGDDDGEVDLTVAGQVFGTPAYMAPEQVRGNTTAIDRRTDVWALGAMLFECVTLVRPFAAATASATMKAILEREPENPRKLNASISRDLAIILQVALAKRREDRYETALAFAQELQRLRQRKPIQARPAGPVTRLARWVERNPLVAGAWGAAVLLLIAGLVVTAIKNAQLASKNTELEQEQVATAAALDRARRQEYRVALIGARSSAANGSQREAATLLAACPEDLRGWEWHHVSLEVDASVKTLAIGGRHRPLELAFTPDGGELIAGTSARIRGWKTADWKVSRDVELEAQDAATDMAFSFGSDLAIVAGHAKPYILSLVNGRRLHDLSHEAHSLACLPDGRIATLLPWWVRQYDQFWTGFIEIHELETGGLRDQFWYPEGVDYPLLPQGGGWLHIDRKACGLVADQAGRRLAAAVRTIYDHDQAIDETVHVRDVEGGDWRPLRIPGVLPSFEMIFSPSGSELLVGYLDGTVGIWDPKTGGLQRRVEIGDGPVTALTISPDGERMAAACAQSETVVIETGSYDQRMTLGGHWAAVTSLAFSPEGDFLASASLDGTVRAWRPARLFASRVLANHAVAVSWIRVSHDGAFVLSASEDGVVLRTPISAPDAGRVVHPVTDEGSGSVCGVDSSGTRIVVERPRGTVEVIETASGQVLQRHVLPSDLRPEPESLLSAVMDDSADILIVDGRGDVVLCDNATQELSTLWKRGDASEFTRVNAITRDGRFALFSAASDEQAGSALDYRDLDRRRSPMVRALRRSDTHVHMWSVITAFAASSDGAVIALGSVERSIKVVDLESEEERPLNRVGDGGEIVIDETINHPAEPGEFLGRRANTTVMAFDDTGARLAAASRDATDIDIWEVASGQLIHRLEGRGAGVTRLIWLPGHERLVSADRDGAVRVWDTRHGELVLTLEMGAGVTDLGVTPDGHRLLVAGEDGKVRVLESNADQVYSVVSQK
ncbi:MAG: protein kinase [Planctomycetes bacterium]|nr:protein kinase [Planctomycetota bacterium]